MKILSNEPIGKDLFEGQSQERIADLIFKSLEAARSSRDAAVRISGNSVVGIEGGWGCGKSNVLKILEAKLDGVLENKKKVYSVFLYDLWGRQQDLQRKTILQDLAAHLKNKCHIDKDKEVRELIIKKTEVGQEFVKKGLFARLLPVVLSGFVTVFLATAALSKEDSWMRNISGWVALGVGVVVCICGAISLWKYKDDAFAAITEFLGNMLLIKTNGAELPRMMYEHQYSVTVSDFSKLLTEIASELVTKERHLIVVFDNIDRLPIDKVKEFLSSAHILFAERKETMLTNIHVIIPFDRNRILTAFDGQDGNDYINKTFDVVYRVAPPILKDWEKFFLERYQEATADEPVLLSQSLEVQDVFNVLSSPRNLTPRAIIAFLNSITAAHNVLGDSVPLKAIAVHELAWKPYEQKMALDKGEASKPEASELNETRIRNGRFISNALLQAKYLGDENWQKWMAAIVFQVEASRAGEILNFNLLKDALENGRSEDVLKMSDLPSFRMLFRRILPTVRTPERIPAAILNIGDENRQWCWDEVNDTRGNDIARISTDPIGFDDWHRNMLKNVSDWRGYARAFLQLDVPIDSRGPIEGQFKRSCDVDKALKESDRTLVNAFHAQRVEPAQYLGILRVAKDRVDVMGWECNPEVFDDYIAKLNISSGAAFGIEWLPEEIALKMPKTKQAFEGLTTVANPSMPRGMMVNTTLEILERLSKGMVKMSLRDEFKRDFILDGHTTERENCRAYAVALGMNLDVPASSGLYKFISNSDSRQHFKMLADLFERYVSVEVLLEKLSANSAYPVYVEALRDVLKRSTEKFAEAKGRSLLAIFGDVVETLSIDPGMLASRIPNLANIEIASHSKFFRPKTLHQLKKCGGPLWEFAFASVRANLDAFDKDTWVAKLSSATPKWSPRAAVEIGYAWTSLAQEGAKEVLRMVVTGRMPNGVVPSEETWNMLVADFESKHIGVGEWFKDLKDQIIDFSGTITAKSLAFLAPWLFKYASFGVNKDELRKLLPDATVRRDASCKKLMAENKDAVMQMFNKGDAATQDAFKAYITAEVNAHPDSPLSVFKEIIGDKQPGTSRVGPL